MGKTETCKNDTKIQKAIQEMKLARRNGLPAYSALCMKENSEILHVRAMRPHGRELCTVSAGASRSAAAAQRVRFGSEEQQNERAMSFAMK